MIGGSYNTNSWPVQYPLYRAGGHPDGIDAQVRPAQAAASRWRPATLPQISLRELIRRL
jgi:hypothetical protein